MFLKSFKVLWENKIVYNISFRKGLNLILNESPKKFFGISVQNLIDYVLGKSSNEDVNFLIEKNLSKKNISLEVTLAENLEIEFSNKIRVSVDFNKDGLVSKKINGLTFEEKEFEKKLFALTFSGLNSEGLRFKDLTSHNFRYQGETINDTLEKLNEFQENDTHLRMFYYFLGFDYDYDKKRLLLLDKLNESMKKKLELINEVEAGNFELDTEAFEFILKSLEENSPVKIDLNILIPILSSRKDIRRIISHHENILGKYYYYLGIVEKINLLKENGFSEEIIGTLSMEYHLPLNTELRTSMSFQNFIDLNIRKKIKELNESIENINESVLKEKIQYHEEEIQFCLENENFLESKLRMYFKDLVIQDIKNRDNDDYFENSHFYFVRKIFEEVNVEIRVLEIHLRDLEKAVKDNGTDKKMYFHIQDFNMGFSRMSQKINYTWLGIGVSRELSNNLKEKYKLTTYIKNKDDLFEQRQLFCFEMYYMMYADEGNLPCLHFLLSEDDNLIYDLNLVNESSYIENKNVQLIVSAQKAKLSAQLLKEENIVADLFEEAEIRTIGEIS